MHRLKTIAVERYRSFARETRLELRPLTLLYGHNNAGKSALLRLLPILENSVRDEAVAPLDLSGAGGDAGHRDVVWRAADDLTLKLELGWAGLVARYELNYFDDGSRELAYIRRLCIHEGERITFDQSVKPDGSLDEWEGPGPGGQTTRRLPFVGLMPPEGSGVGPLERLAERLGSLRGCVHWLRSVRQLSSPDIPVRGRLLTRLRDPGGGDAPEALAADPELFGEVAAWYAHTEITRRLRLGEAGLGRRNLFLDPVDGAVSKIRLAETGEGMIQVLPVLTAIALARRQGGHAIVAVEEPESHLHANAQRALAEHLSQVALAPNAPALVLETHSRLLLLGIQLAVARDDRLREKVAIYWIHNRDGISQAFPARIEPGGGLRGWPPGVFAEDRTLARELLEIQLRLDEETA